VDPPEQFRSSPAPLLRALLEQEICDSYTAARVLLAKGMRRLAWRQLDRAHALNPLGPAYRLASAVPNGHGQTVTTEPTTTERNLYAKNQDLLHPHAYDAPLRTRRNLGSVCKSGMAV
jgi:hypothetical protein